MKPFYEQQPLRFSCTQCGQCCRTGGDYYVYLARGEAEKIRHQLQLSHAWFRRRYLEQLDDGEWVLVSGAGERCVFLAKDGRCKVYAVRPVQCRTYPFWPELAGVARAWRREARRCEGINQGEVVPKAVIRRHVKACS